MSARAAILLRPALLSLLISALVLAACGGGPPQAGRVPLAVPPATPASEETTVTYEGIDVSHYQGDVDWFQVKAAGLVFAFTKATQGTSEVDPRFAANWAGIRDVGLVRGAYHFLDPDQDAAAQAEHFLATVALEAGDLPPVLDVEVTEGLSVEALDEAVRTWLEKVAAATGTQPILYSDLSFLESELAKAFGAYPLWIAKYASTPPKPPAAWTTWAFWQYSDTGEVSGVDGQVDRDRYQGTAAGFRQLLVGAPE